MHLFLIFELIRYVESVQITSKKKVSSLKFIRYEKYDNHPYRKY